MKTLRRGFTIVEALVVVSIVATEQRGRVVGAVALIATPARRDEIEALLTRQLAGRPLDKREQLDALIAEHIAQPGEPVAAD